MHSSLPLHVALWFNNDCLDFKVSPHLLQTYFFDVAALLPYRKEYMFTCKTTLWFNCDRNKRLFFAVFLLCGNPLGKSSSICLRFISCKVGYHILNKLIFRNLKVRTLFFMNNGYNERSQCSSKTQNLVTDSSPQFLPTRKKDESELASKLRFNCGLYKESNCVHCWIFIKGICYEDINSFSHTRQSTIRYLHECFAFLQAEPLLSSFVCNCCAIDCWRICSRLNSTFRLISWSLQHICLYKQRAIPL